MNNQQEFHAYDKSDSTYMGVVVATPEQLADMGFFAGNEPVIDPAIVLAQARAVMVISPLQGILTLGETEWGKVLAYRETASWQEKIIIDNADDWNRTSQNIAFFGYLLQYSDERMDQLFISAAKVKA